MGQDRKTDPVAGVSPTVRWFHIFEGNGCLVLAMLTEEGPSAYSLPPAGAFFLGDALCDAAARMRRKSQKLAADMKAQGPPVGSA